MSWGAMRDRMHQRVVARLNDGCAQYQGPDGSVVCTIPEVIIDRNLMRRDEDGVAFLSEAVGVTWRSCHLKSADRGGIFTHCGERLLVVDIIADDGLMVTAACKVQP